MKTRKKLLRFTKQISTLCMSVLLLLMCAIPVAANDSAPVGAVISESPAPAPATAPAVTIQDYVDAMQPGYNLGNTFDAFGGDWVQEVQDTVTQDFINEIARQGFKSIRIPITWEWGGHTGAAPDYTVDPAWMNRIQQVVDWSLDAGLYVMINLHHDNIRWINQMPTNHDAVLAQYNALWTQIADRFKNHSNKLMFESVNEPQFVNVDNAKQNELLDELNTSFFHIVRASGGANDVRPLVLPTLVTNGDQLDMDYLASTMAKLNDKNLIATIHFYGFWPFGINIAGYSTFEHNGDTAKDIDELAARAYNTFIAKGVPVVIGEFGVFGWDSWGAGDDVPEKGEANKFFEYSTYVFKQNKLTYMLWDNTSRFDRSTYKWNDQDTYNYIMAGLEGRSSTAESDLIFIKKGAPAQDTVIHLNLNGNNLTGITAGNESLTAGSDYVVNGNDLVLKAGFIAKLIQSAQLGEVAVLKAHFNKGVDWTFHVMYNDTPVQQNAEGSNTNFAIPTAFNGDRLATMEAVYTKGGNAGPANWTSYKAIAESYKLSYATNEILLTENFFKEVTSGDEVVLTFYFRSGAVLEYKVTKNGTSVTGTAPNVPAPTPAPGPAVIQDYVDAMQPGYNLGNTFDAFGGDWVQEVQDTVTQDFINEIARQGFKSIRIPITWEWGGHTGAAPDYTVDPAWMNRIQQVVDWSLDAGLYVMINLHHDNIRWINQMPTNHDAVLAQYNALWTQIADRFKNHSNKLMFESVNEPQFVNVDNAKQNELLDELNTSFFHIVRASGGANDVRPLVLPTLVTNGDQLDMDYLASTMAKLNDKNLIATIHFYGFWPFGINIAGYSTFEHNGDTAKDIDELAARAYNTFIAKGVPVVIGEFGVFGWDSWGAGDDVPEKGEANKFFEYSTYVFKQNKLTYMLWDNTSRFDRSTYKWNDQDTYNYIMAGLEGRSSTAESDLIFIKKGAPAQDTVIHLNLNGNNLTGITAGNESLTAGSDYVVNGNDLVLKAGFIAKLIQSAQLGEVAVLKAHFNKGVDWTFHVMYNDTPVQQNAEGSNTNFAIPTAFNGDRLATMEAVYTKGGIAGPPNWTSYKAIAESYKLSYATNEILLTENFFKEVTSGDEVVLTFYFRSGAVLEYKVTKNGTSVTGKAPSAPSVSITSYEEGQAINSNSPQLDWTFLDAYYGDTQAAYQVQASSDGWKTVGMDSGELAGTSNSYKLSGLADGNWSIKVRAKNNHGTWSEWAYRSLIIDTVAPTLNVVLDKATLWPANNSLVSVKATVKAEDGLSQVESVVLLSITPNTAVDSYESMVQQAEFGTFDTEFMLLAKKAKGMEPLVYTVKYRAVDRAGNVTETSVTVTVPHDQSEKK